MCILETKNVYKVYLDQKKTKGRLVLNDVSLKIDEGEFVCLIGPSGCGKTTMLNLMAGFETPTRGEVLYRGNPIKKPSWERELYFRNTACCHG